MCDNKIVCSTKPALLQSLHYWPSQWDFIGMHWLYQMDSDIDNTGGNRNPTNT